MFPARSGWLEAIPLSRTATSTFELPRVRVQAAGASMSLSLGWERPQVDVEDGVVRNRAQPVDVVRLRVKDVRVALELGDGGLDGDAVRQTDERRTGEPQALDEPPLGTREGAGPRRSRRARTEADDDLARHVLGRPRSGAVALEPGGRGRACTRAGCAEKEYRQRHERRQPQSRIAHFGRGMMHYWKGKEKTRVSRRRGR